MVCDNSQFSILNSSFAMNRHFTATAFVRNSEGRVLLLWHKRLGRWMPPGGHCDPDETPEETARRECKEETGLDVEITGDAQPDLFDGAVHEGMMLKRPFAMLLENIPAYDKPVAGGIKHEPAHEHMDFLYLAKPLDESQALVIAEQEADHLRWFTAEEIDALGDEEIFANVRAYLRYLSGQR
jgi:8-oxo-dGTP pyrophosphatase MutT (NUDIX family)